MKTTELASDGSTRAILGTSVLRLNVKRVPVFTMMKTHTNAVSEIADGLPSRCRCDRMRQGFIEEEADARRNSRIARSLSL
jgi:hypothetical protein